MICATVSSWHIWFLSRVSTLTHDIDIAILSVHPSVTFWYSVETTEHIVIVSSPHDSSMCITRHSSFISTKHLHEILTWSHRVGVLNTGGV